MKGKIVLAEGNAQIPAVLLWHFTDQHYHTDLDRIDMVSAASERHTIDPWRDFYLGASERIPDIAVGPIEIIAAMNAAKSRMQKAAIHGFQANVYFTCLFSAAPSAY